MATYLQVFGAGANSPSEQQRCDAHCHNAKSARCVCCCGGRYHGLGEGTPAMEAEIAATTNQWLDGLEGQGVDVGELRKLAQQRSLF